MSRRAPGAAFGRWLQVEDDWGKEYVPEPSGTPGPATA